MEMRAIELEDISIGQDLTPPLRPLAAVLRDSAVSSHCSACFSTLPPQPFPPNPQHVPNNSTPPLYCSSSCCSYDSPLHSSSGEAHILRLRPPTWNDSSDLRLSLRLASVFEQHSFSPTSTTSHRQNGAVLERIAGLMTNREKLVFEEDENNEDVLERIREGAKLMAKARRACLGEDLNMEEQEGFVLEEMVLCLVLTNAVEVQDKSGCTIGVAVYDTAFSWINHSCSPNACYRFLVGPGDGECPRFRIAPAAKNGFGDGLMVEGGVEKNGYGPRVIVRSIKDVKKGEEVTIAYTDLLQPKEMRRAELWSKYQFSCSCKRCDAVPATYVDNALQALSAINPDTSSEYSIDKLMHSFDDAITDYLSFDDPISCCKKLENLLSHGHSNDESLDPKEASSPHKLKLHPFHYLSINAYTTLSSAYKVGAKDLALDNDAERRNFEAFNLYKTSTAYSLLLAGVVHHLFTFEPALIATAANLWINAGESLLDFARSPAWDSILSPDPTHQKCNHCCLADDTLEFKQIKSRMYNCIAGITAKVWGVLGSESRFLKVVRNPVDFSWLGSSGTVGNSQSDDDEKCDEHVRMNLVLLGEHCFKFGVVLSSVCYGLSTGMDCYYRTFIKGI